MKTQKIIENDLKCKEKNYVCKDRKTKKSIAPELVILNETYINFDDYKSLVKITDEFGVSISEMVTIAICNLKKIRTINISFQLAINGIPDGRTLEDHEIVKQSRIQIWEKIGKKTYGGVYP